MRFFLSSSALAVLAVMGVANGAIAQSSLNPSVSSMLIAQTMESMGTVNGVREGIVRVTTEDGTLHLVPLSEVDINRLGLDAGDEVVLTFEDDWITSIAKDDVVVSVVGASTETVDAETVEESAVVEEETVVEEEIVVEEETVVVEEEIVFEEEVVEEETVITEDAFEFIPALW